MSIRKFVRKLRPVEESYLPPVDKVEQVQSYRTN